MRAPAVRGRRRHGRRAGGRGGVGDRGPLVRRRAAQRLAPRGARQRHRGGQQADPRQGARGRVDARHGHDDDGRLRRRRRGGHRPRRRLPRLPAARRRADPADQGPLAGRRARGARQADRGAGRAAPAALGDHPRAGPRGQRAGGRRHLPGQGRRPLPALLRRPDLDGPRAEAAPAVRGRRLAGDARQAADRRRQRGRRARQHHGDPVPARGGRGRRGRRPPRPRPSRARTRPREYETFEGDAVPRAAPGRHAPGRRQRRRGAALVGGLRHRRGRLPASGTVALSAIRPGGETEAARGAAAAGTAAEPRRRRAHRAAPPRFREIPAPNLAASAAGASQSASSSPSPSSS